MDSVVGTALYVEGGVIRYFQEGAGDGRQPPPDSISVGVLSSARIVRPRSFR
jgi:hypothetical protein